MNAQEEEIEDGSPAPKLGAFYSYKDTFNDDNIWVKVPKKGGQDREIKIEKGHLTDASR